MKSYSSSCGFWGARHDDRLLRMLQVLGTGLTVDVRELLLQQESTDAAHTSERRPRVSQIMENYRLEESLVAPAPQVIGLVDDVLTTGAHFKAAQNVLSGRFPGVRIYGLFVARRVPESSDIIEF